MQLHQDQLKNRLDYNQVAKEYALHRKVQPEVFNQLVNVGRIHSNAKILEVGCGTGNYITAIHDFTGCACSGIDPSSEMLAQAKLRSKGINFNIGRAERIDFPENFFDLAYSVDVIHHVQDKSAYYHEAFRVLARGGQVCTVTESTWMIRNRRPFALYFPETVKVDLSRYPTRKDLVGMMQEAGFTNIRCKTLSFLFQHSNIQDFRDKAYSCLHLISERGFEQGMERMEQDLKIEPILWDSRYLMIWGEKP